VFFLGTSEWIKDSLRMPEVWNGKVHFTDDLGTHGTEFRLRPRQFDRLAPMLPGQGRQLSAPPIRRGWGYCRCGEADDGDPRRA
jgi:hypothetical protein